MLKYGKTGNGKYGFSSPWVNGILNAYNSSQKNKTYVQDQMAAFGIDGTTTVEQTIQKIGGT